MFLFSFSWFSSADRVFIEQGELGNVEDEIDPIEDGDIRVTYGDGTMKDGNGKKRTFKEALLANTPEEYRFD